MIRRLAWVVCLWSLAAPGVAAQDLAQAIEAQDPKAVFDWAKARSRASAPGSEMSKALGIWLQAEEAYAELPRTSARAYFLPFVKLQAGEYLRHAGRLGAAQARVDEARGVLYTGDYARLHASAMGGLLRLGAHIRLDQGRIDQARPLVEEARDLLEAIGDRDPHEREALVAVLKVQVSLRLAQGRYGQALESAEAALSREELFVGHSYAAHERARLRLLAALAAWGLERRGLRPIDFGRSRFEQLLETDGLGALSRGQAQLSLLEISLAQGRYGDAKELLATIDAEGPPNGTRPWTRRAALRGRLALDGPRSDANTATALADLRAAYAGWIRERRADSQPRSHFNFREPQDLLGELIRLELACQPGSGGIEKALQHVFEAQMLGSLVRELAARPVTIQELRGELLGPDEALVILVTSTNISHVFAIDQDQVVHASTLSERGLLDKLVRPFRQAVFPVQAPRDAAAAEKRLNEIERLGEQLFTALFPEPVNERVRAHRQLTFVGSDQLGYVPLAALPLPTGGWLGDEVALGFLSSAPAGLAMARRDQAQAWDKDLLLVAAPSHGPEARERYPDLAPLELSPEWLERLRGALLPSRILTASGDQANLGTLQSAAAITPRVLTLLGHGAHDPRQERPSGLILAGRSDWRLGSDQVAKLAPPWLTVLAACGASRGPWRRGDPDAGHLVGAFVAAGSQAVVHAEVDIRLPSAVRMVGHLHSFLAAGHSSAESLRLARLELAKDSAFADPAHRCALQVTGLVHRPVFPGGVPRGDVSGETAPSRLWIALALLAAGYAVAVVLSRRRRRHTA